MKGFFKSFVFAARGMKVAFLHERNFKVQLCVALLTIGAGFYYSISAIEWIAITILIGLVLSLEMVNTALENLVNLVTQERKPLAGKIKDLAAGAVLLASIIAAIAGIIIFRKYLL